MEFGRLTAVFDADTSKFDAGGKRVLSTVNKLSGETGKLSNVFRGLSTATASVDGPLGGIAGRLSSLSSLTAGLTSATGALGVAFGAVAVATIAAGGAIYNLTTSVAEATGRFNDLAQQTGFSVETLSALANAAETSGGSIDTVTNSLNIFQANMVAAREKGSEMSKLFKVLKIDTEDNEKALRQTLAAISNLTRAEDQAAVGKKILGRGFKELNAAVKEAGSLDAYMAEQLRKGTLITTDAARRGDALSDSVIEMGRAFESARRIVADQFGPDVLRIVKAVTKAIEDNRAGVKAWADEFRLAADGLQPLIASIRVLDNALRNLIGIPVVDFLGKIIRYGSGAGLLITGLQAIGGATRGPTVSVQTQAELLKMNQALLPASQRFKTLGTPFKTVGPAFTFPTATKGGGGGGEDPAKLAQRIAQLQLEATTSGLKAEQEANRRALDLRRQDFNDYAREYTRIEKQRHDAVIAGLDAEQRAAERLKKGKDVALLEIANKRTAENTTHEQNRNRVLDERAHILDQIDKFMRDQERDLQGVTSATDQWDKAYQDLVDTLKEEGVVLEDNMKRRIESNIVMLKEIDLVKQQIRVRQVLKDAIRERFETRAGRERLPWIDLGLGSTAGGEPGTTTRPRIATAEEQGLRDRLEIIRKRMHELSGELTNVFSQSISDGFNNGIKSGLQTLTQGLLRIVEDVFLRRLADGLGNLLTGLASGGGGGGFWSKLLGITVGGLTGGFAGGPSGAATGGIGSRFAGAFATGGNIPMGQWGIVHDNEQVYVTPAGAQVIPAVGGRGGPQMVTNKQYIINLPPDSRGNYSSPRSKRQLSDKLIAALQASQA